MYILKNFAQEINFHKRQDFSVWHLTISTLVSMATTDINQISVMRNKHTYIKSHDTNVVLQLDKLE